MPFGPVEPPVLPVIPGVGPLLEVAGNVPWLGATPPPPKGVDDDGELGGEESVKPRGRSPRGWLVVFPYLLIISPGSIFPPGKTIAGIVMWVWATPPISNAPTSGGGLVGARS